MQTNENIQEDEIDLRELFTTVYKAKLFIAIFVIISTIGAVVYAISKPNIYESKAIFMPTSDTKSNNIVPEDLEGFVSLSFGQSGGVYETYSQLSKSFNFMQGFILKYKLYDTFFETKNNVFAFGISPSKTELEPFGDIEKTLSPAQLETLFKIFKQISTNLGIDKDKKTNLVTFSYKGPNRYLNKSILDHFLDYSGSYLKNKEMKQLDDKIATIKIEITKLRNIDLKNKMLELSATIFKRKVFLQAEDYSGLQSIVMPEVSYIKEKVAPKRALIVVVAMVTSFILAIFLVFFREFIKKGED
ncbi:MAG: hypothetical protein JJW00_09130 [Sulfurimonas sp.]|nr:hypothetical protein [Sulfurimonas sp.]